MVYYSVLNSNRYWVHTCVLGTFSSEKIPFCLEAQIFLYQIGVLQMINNDDQETRAEVHLYECTKDKTLQEQSYLDFTVLFMLLRKILAPLKITLSNTVSVTQTSSPPKWKKRWHDHQGVLGGIVNDERQSCSNPVASSSFSWPQKSKRCKF